MRHFLVLCVLPFLALAASVPAKQEDGDEVKKFNTLNIQAFNIQVFGQSKIGDQDAVDVIIDILMRSDICLIQEIRDSEGTAIVSLLDQLNAQAGGAYEMIISERLGSTSSKEQYAFFYKPSIFSVASEYQYTIDYSMFERSPWIVTFNVAGYDISQFAYLGIHVDPDRAPEEIDNLWQVYEDAAGTDVPTMDWIFGGDFNADCSYVDETDWPNIRLRTDPRFTWVIDDDEDTNLADSSCAYDRFVLTDGVLSRYLPAAAAFDYWTAYGLTEEKAKDVSDHYPIEMQLD